MKNKILKQWRWRSIGKLSIQLGALYSCCRQTLSRAKGTSPITCKKVKDAAAAACQVLPPLNVCFAREQQTTRSRPNYVANFNADLGMDDVQLIRVDRHLSLALPLRLRSAVQQCRVLRGFTPGTRRMLIFGFVRNPPI